MNVFIAVTDSAWFDFLSRTSHNGVHDEVNFWSPQATRPMKRHASGELLFFRLKSPASAIAGYGFFAAFSLLHLDAAWEMFGQRNGYPDKLQFLSRIGRYRKVDLLDPRSPRKPLGCTLLRSAVFWPRERWIPWSADRGWAPNIVQGKTELDPARVELLLRKAASDAPEELSIPSFEPLDVDDRQLVTATTTLREGQGVFRTRVLDAYGRRCAITGEHTEVVLDAAHIQPYLGPRSNHVQNGLLLTKEFHALFDRGYVTVTPEYMVRVSAQLREEWRNGRRYYPYDGVPLAQVPDDPRTRPSQAALAWHAKHVFRDAA